MSDAPPVDGEEPAEKSKSAREEPDDPWRTLTGLLGRAWLARQSSASRSGGFAPTVVAAAGPLPPVPIPLLEHEGRVPGPSAVTARPTAGPPAPVAGPRPVGGVASFVMEVATSHAPVETPAPRAGRSAGGYRPHRPNHCRLGTGHDHISHNTCQRLPPPS